MCQFHGIILVVRLVSAVGPSSVTDNLRDSPYWFWHVDDNDRWTFLRGINDTLIEQ